MPARYSRHYYDVYMIYKSNYFPKIVENKRLFEEVKRFKSKYYRTSWSNIENSSLDNMHIVPTLERSKEILIDYNNMKDMIFENRPSFEDIINGLRELENVLKNA